MKPIKLFAILFMTVVLAVPCKAALLNNDHAEESFIELTAAEPETEDSEENTEPEEPAITPTPSPPEEPTVTPAPKPIPDGWKKLKNGKKAYYLKGARVTGRKKIKKKWYYFNEKGIMQVGTKKVGKITYYLTSKGVLKAMKKKSKYYRPNGKPMDSIKAQDFDTLQTAKSIVKKITTSKMSKSEKMKKCFDWVISKPYITYRTFSNTKGWPAVYANDHFKRRGGNCFSDAAAFAYLAKAVGYKKIYVCVDCDGRGGRGHSWTEIDGRVYDPLFAEAKSYSRNFGVPYGVYILHPILHIAV